MSDPETPAENHPSAGPKPAPRYRMRLHPGVAALMAVAVLTCLWLTGVLSGKADLGATAAGVILPIAAILVGLLLAAIAYGIFRKSNKAFNITIAACMVAFMGLLGWMTFRRASNFERSRQEVASHRRGNEAAAKASKRFAAELIDRITKYRADMDAYVAAGGITPTTLTDDAAVSTRLDLVRNAQASHRHNCALAANAEGAYTQMLREDGCPEAHIGSHLAEFRGTFSGGQTAEQCELHARALDATVAYLEFLHSKAGAFSFDGKTYRFQTAADVEQFEKLRVRALETSRAMIDFFEARRGSK